MPSLRTALLASAAAVAAEVNVYYGQHGSTPLGDVCATGVDFVTLSFINITPENGGLSGYAGDNFGNHCYAGYYDGSTLLYDCPAITSGIATCRGLGTKLLLSIGGVFDAASNYTLSSDAEAEAFADFLWGSFGPYNSEYTGPRPFDTDDAHFAVDGFDLDIEHKFADQGPWNTLVAALRAKSSSLLVTAAPQCPFSDANFEMADILAGSRFDRLWVQFYNNPVCDGVAGGFNYDAWLAYLAGTPNAQTPLLVGLPGSADGAGSGYVDSALLLPLLAAYATHPNFGGVMLWDEYFAQQNAVGDGNYLTYVQSLLSSLAPATSTSSTISSTSTSASSTSTSSTVTTTSEISTSTSSTVSSTTSTSTSASSTVSSTSTSSTSTSASSTSTSSSVTSTSTSSTSSTSTSTVILSSSSTSTTILFSSSSSVSSTSASASSTIPTSSASVSSTSTSASSFTIPTSSSLSTSATSIFTSASSTPSISSNSSATPTSFSNSSLTTITIRTTSASTIYSCASAVTNCPYNSVTTVVVDLYTTICPVSQVSQVLASATATPTVSESANESASLSTVYSTLYETVTSCAASVTNCPARITSTVIPVTVVTVPVSAASSVPVGSSSVPAGFVSSAPVASSSVPVTVSSVPVNNVVTSSVPFKYANATASTAFQPSGSLLTSVKSTAATASPTKPASASTTPASPAKSTVPVVTAGASALTGSLGLAAVIAVLVLVL